MTLYISIVKIIRVLRIQFEVWFKHSHFRRKGKLITKMYQNI
jgi:hypothetical protein